MEYIDLNCDLGESYGAYTLGRDDLVIPYISSANVACGFHASDPMVMSKTVAWCKEHNVCVGAHPGFPDLVGFGRRNMEVTPEEAKTMVQYQVGALMAFCQAYKISLQHVKPHGALYNMAAKDYILAKAICEGVKEISPNLILLVLYGSEMERAANDLGMKVAREVFADRGYNEDGSLVDRRKPGAFIHNVEEAIHRVIMMVKEKKVVTITGKEIPIYADSICVHGDGEKALLFVKCLREACSFNQIRIQSLENTINL